MPGSIIRAGRTQYELLERRGDGSIDIVRYHIIAVVQDSVTELNARYRAGELHMTAVVPPEDFVQVQEELGDPVRVLRHISAFTTTAST